MIMLARFSGTDINQMRYTGYIHSNMLFTLCNDSRNIIYEDIYIDFNMLDIYLVQSWFKDVVIDITCKNIYINVFCHYAMGQGI